MGGRTDRDAQGVGRTAGPIAPQPASVTRPPEAEALPCVSVPEAGIVAWWWAACHGGAGASTLAAGVGGGDTHGCWPVPAAGGGAARVVLVARTNHHGLTRAQLAVRQWASGGLPPGIRLAGLVLVADQPGRLPRQLGRLADLVAGGVPHVWRVPWIDGYRLGPLPDEQAPYARLRAELTELATGGANHRV